MSSATSTLLLCHYMNLLYCNPTHNFVSTFYIGEPDFTKLFFILQCHATMTDANTVSLKLPPFWPAQATVLFLQAESQFHVHGIVADETKYHYIIGVLNQATASHLVDFLSHPLSSNQYNALKTHLLTTFGLSHHKCVAHLPHLCGLCDHKPSDLMDEMLALADGHLPCFLFKQIFWSNCLKTCICS